MDLGKLDPELLSREVLEVLPCTDERVLIGPGIGEDTSVVSLSGLSDHLLVASSDPITGAEHDIGRYAVHVNANDVATAGARPSLFLCNILLSKSSSREELRSILSQIRRECEALQISVIGGHTEVSPIERTVVSSTMLGFVRRDMLARRRVEPGDLVVGQRLALLRRPRGHPQAALHLAGLDDDALDGAAGDHAGDDEDHHRDAQESGDDQQQPTDEIGRHGDFLARKPRRARGVMGARTPST